MTPQQRLGLRSACEWFIRDLKQHGIVTHYEVFPVLATTAQKYGYELKMDSSQVQDSFPRVYIHFEEKAR